MSDLSGWDVAILAVAAYISIVALVRLMRKRRDEVVNQYQRQIADAKQQQRIEQLRRSHQESRARQIRALQPRRDSDDAAA